jgi:hypothetical protein
VGTATCLLLPFLVRAEATGSLPPACDPSKAGPGVPGCPSVLERQVGDIEEPGVSLPDLVPDVTEAWVEYQYIDFNGRDFDFGPASLTFDTLAQNLGQVPVDLQADEPSNVAGSPVSQCISWTTNLVCRQRAHVGGFTWHQEHMHFHFNDFASYELRTVNPDGSPNLSDDGFISSSPKVSFCLVDSTKVRNDAAPVPRYTNCNPYQEGISPGYTDTYGAGLEGQYLPFNGLGDGRYALVVSLNSAGHVYETNNDNNRVVVILNVEGLGTFDTTVTFISKSPL